MLDIYEKLTPIVGSKGGIKEETIEDVEMEDVMYSSNFKPSRLESKKETSDRSAPKTGYNTPQKSASSSVKGFKTERCEESKPVISDPSTKDKEVENKNTTEDSTTKSQEGEKSNDIQSKDSEDIPCKEDVKARDREPAKEDSIKQETDCL